MKDVKDISISCIIPMHNEKDNAERIVNDTENVLSGLLSDWEIIIVESGSTDDTWKKICEVIKGKDRIRAFHQDKKEGAGSAFRLGYAKCTKDFIFHLEADSPFEMTYFKKALPILLANDCVIGYRVGAHKQNFKWSYYNMGEKALLRGVFHSVYNSMLRMIFGLRVKDVNFSFKIFKRTDIQKLNLISNGWFIDAEILLELKKNGILPIEMPIEYRDRTAGRSTVNMSTPLNMLREMMRYIAFSRNKRGKCRT